MSNFSINYDSKYNERLVALLKKRFSDLGIVDIENILTSNPYAIPTAKAVADAMNRAGVLPVMNETTTGMYLTNDGKDAYWAYNSYDYATEDEAGIVKIATEAQALAGVDNLLMMTPALSKIANDARYVGREYTQALFLNKINNTTASLQIEHPVAAASNYLQLTINSTSYTVSPLFTIQRTMLNGLTFTNKNSIAVDLYFAFNRASVPGFAIKSQAVLKRGSDTIILSTEQENEADNYAGATDYSVITDYSQFTISLDKIKGAFDFLKDDVLEIRIWAKQGDTTATTARYLCGVPVGSNSYYSNVQFNSSSLSLDKMPYASTDKKGLIMLATQAEVNAGTESTKAVTPALLTGTKMVRSSSQSPNLIKYVWSGTTEQYNALTNKDPYTLYHRQDLIASTWIDTYTTTANQTQFTLSHEVNSESLILSVNIENQVPLHDNYSVSGNTLTLAFPIEEAGMRVEIQYFVGCTITWVPYANAAEVAAGTITNKAINPATLKTELDKKPDKSLFIKKGDLYVASGSGVVTRQEVGSNGTYLVADSTTNTGLKYQSLPTSSTSQAGIVQLASASETTAGTIGTKAVTPASLKTELNKKFNSSDIAKQSQTLYQTLIAASANIALADDKVIYSLTVSSPTTFTFDVTNATQKSSKVITFELLVTLQSVVALTFPSTLKWINDDAPSIDTAGKKYLFAFRTFDAGANWVGNLQGFF